MTQVEAPAPFTVAKVRPPIVSKGKISLSLARAEILGVGVQVVSPDSGETNLHSHPGVDSAWLVLDGQATFYTEEDRLVAELSRHELLMIPAGAPYWFKASGEKPVVLLHVTARKPGISGTSRLDYTPPIDKPQDLIPGVYFEG